MRGERWTQRKDGWKGREKVEISWDHACESSKEQVKTEQECSCEKQLLLIPLAKLLVVWVKPSAWPVRNLKYEI